MGRADVRLAVQNWFDPLGAWTDPPDALDRVLLTFPKEIDFRTSARIPNQSTNAVGVVFITGQTEKRETIGGQHQGWKSVDFAVVLQMFCESVYDDALDVMNDVDTLADTVHDRAVADHTFGQPDTKIFMAAEPEIGLEFGEPMLNEAAAVEQWFQIRFTVTQWYQA